MTAFWDRFDALPASTVYVAIGLFLFVFALYKYLSKHVH